MTTPENTQNRKPLWKRILGWTGKALLVIVVLIVAYYAAYFIFRGPVPEGRVVVAHRGGGALAPENTMTAFENAIAVGADYIEFDVHRTKDGELVIMHDDTVDRTTNGTGMIKDMTAEEFSRLQMADGKEPPTFDAVLVLAKNNDMGMLAEIKSPHLYPGMEMTVLKKLEDADYVNKTVALSFGLDALENMKEADPDIRVCPLYMYAWQAGDPKPENAEIICPMGETTVLYPWAIKKAHDQGRQVWVWPWKVLDNPIGHRILLAMGVDGIIADDPVEARSLVQ